MLLVFVVGVNQGVKDDGEWDLEWAIMGKSGSGNDEQVEDDSKRGGTDDDTGDSLVDEEEVAGEGIAEEEESSLEYQGQAIHDKVETPCDHSVHLVLSMSTTVDNGSVYLRPGITVEPLLTQHGDERNEEGSA